MKGGPRIPFSGDGRLNVGNEYGAFLSGGGKLGSRNRTVESAAGISGERSEVMNKNEVVVVARGMAGAVVGGLIGWGAFHLLIGQGLYGLVLPGALIGLVCGAVSGGVSNINAALCAVGALVVGVLLEWAYFHADKNLGDFLRDLGDLPGITWLMIAAGALFAGWFGRGRARFVKRDVGA
jgi:hypothetical protein